LTVLQILCQDSLLSSCLSKTDLDSAAHEVLPYFTTSTNFKSQVLMEVCFKYIYFHSLLQSSPFLYLHSVISGLLYDDQSSHSHLRIFLFQQKSETLLKERTSMQSRFISQKPHR